MACSGCGRHRAGTSTAVVSSTLSENSGKGNLVLVDYLSPNVGMHVVVGSYTRTQYGRRKGGEQFYIYDTDQQSQPHLFRLVG